MAGYYKLVASMTYQRKAQNSSASRRGSAANSRQRSDRGRLAAMGYDAAAERLSPVNKGQSWGMVYGSSMPIMIEGGVYAESNWIRCGQGKLNPDAASISPLLDLSVGGLHDDRIQFGMQSIPTIGPSGEREGCLIQVVPMEEQLIGFHGMNLGRAVNMRFDIDPMKSGNRPADCEFRLTMTGDVMSRAGQQIAPLPGSGDFSAELIVDGTGKIKEMTVTVRPELRHEDLSQPEDGVCLYLSAHGLDADRASSRRRRRRTNQLD